MGIGSVTVNEKENSLEITPPLDGSYIEVAKDADLNLSDKNIYFKVKVDNFSNLQGFDIYLSNDKWTKSSRYNIANSAYDVSRDGEWLQFGVGKGDLRKSSLGDWVKNDPTFDWSKIDSIKFFVSSKTGKKAKVEVKEFNHRSGW